MTVAEQEGWEDLRVAYSVIITTCQLLSRRDPNDNEYLEAKQEKERIRKQIKCIKSKNVQGRKL